MIAIGFLPFAAPTARLAVGRPIARAIVAVAARLAERDREQRVATRSCWNGVPRGASGRSNTVRVPAKYSRELRRGEREHGVSACGACRPAAGGSAAQFDERVVAALGDELQHADRRVDHRS